MLPLNPASLENNGSTLLNKNFKKTPANKTLKNKSITNYTLNSLDENIIQNRDSGQESIPDSNTSSPVESTKLTNINQLMDKLYNQNNESLNSSNSPTVYDLNNQLPSPPATQSVQTMIQQPSTVQPINDSKVQGSDYNNIKNDSYVPYYTNLTNSPNTATNNTGNNTGNPSNDELLNKLNYIIYMMEEQQSQKTNYVTEELILYVFLGIFIIFVLDNFAKSTKYVR